MKYLGVFFMLICLVTLSACKKRQPALAGPDTGRSTVESPGQPSYSQPEIQLTATPGSIRRGETATLAWSAEGVTSVLIDNGIGNVNESGSVAVTPRESTTFTAIASGPGGEARGSVRVTVTEADSPGLASSDIAALMEALSSGKIKPVFFAYDKADLSEQAKEILAENARWFRRLPGAGVLVEGHCDERGTEEYNLALGDRRAQSAYQYLLELGVNPRQLETVSLGEERPFESGQGESTYSQNRRAHFSARQP